MIIHPFEPVYDSNSRILILGSFPSVKSRQQMFYYGHPQNRFWKMLAGVYQESIPCTIEEKRNFLLAHHLACYDVIYSCDIHGSSDSSITNVTPADLSKILSHASIDRILCNGSKSYELFQKYQSIDLPVFKMPSTSPANAKCSLDELINAWTAFIKI